MEKQSSKERSELMNTRMMLALAGDECCQCGNVAKSNTNFQCAYDKAAADKLGIGNIGTGNTSTMATFSRLPAALKHGGK